MKQSIISLVLDLIFPSFCCGCGRINTLLCNDCYNQIDYYSLPVHFSFNKNYLDQSFALTEYAGISKKIITTCKYQGVKAVSELMAELLFFTGNNYSFDLITAVPLHPKKLRERGFNQAEVIAKRYAELLDKPYYSLLERTKHLPAQASITDKNKRLHILKNIFILSSRYIDTPLLHDKVVLIIDDVCTTGATLTECAKVLKKAGAKKVISLTIAHGS